MIKEFTLFVMLIETSVGVCGDFNSFDMCVCLCCVCVMVHWLVEVSIRTCKYVDSITEFDYPIQVAPLGLWFDLFLFLSCPRFDVICLCIFVWWRVSRLLCSMW